MKREFLQELGLESDTIDKVMAEYGKNVNSLKESADKLETLTNEHTALQEKYSTDISGINSKLEAATNNAADYEGLKGTLETMKADNLRMADEHREALLGIKKNSTADKALEAVHAKKNYIDIIKSQLNIDSLQLEGDNLIGLTDKLQATIEKYPDMFGKVETVGTTVQTGVVTQVVGTFKSKYDEAMKSGDRKQAIKIKQEAYDKGEGF